VKLAGALFLVTTTLLAAYVAFLWRGMIPPTWLGLSTGGAVLAVLTLAVVQVRGARLIFYPLCGATIAVVACLTHMLVTGDLPPTWLFAATATLGALAVGAVLVHAWRQS
jgi:hypothetical protein